MADVSGNDYIELNDDFPSSIDNYEYEEHIDEVQSESFTTIDYPSPYDYTSDFQTLFSLISFLIAVSVGGLCLMCFLKGFK